MILKSPMRHYLASLLFFSVTVTYAQHFCSTTEKQEEWFLLHPELKEHFYTRQQKAAETDRELYKTGYSHLLSAGKSAAATYTIPVVFHILHTGGSENISDAQVQDAVSILTRDFNRKNADTSDVVVQFKNNIGDVQIEFVLATKDPNGNCTNGIIRHFDANTDWTGNSGQYVYSWPATKYLNIYVVRSIASGAAGYTYLPGSGIPQAMDAIVILNGYVGSIGTGNLNTSRALTHEVGHWLDLPHVWGFNNNPGQVCGDEGISDTPVTKGFTSCNLTNAASCNSAIVENVQNYMDYSYCCKMFTKGQASRMQQCLNGSLNGRNVLSSPANLIATGVVNPISNCIPMLDILAKPSLTVCSGKMLKVFSYTSNATPSTYSWSADNSASVLSPSTASTSILFNSVGLTNVYCTVSNSFGSDTKSLSVYVLNGATQITSTQLESFESPAANLPANWSRINPSDPAQQWEISSGIASNGIRAVYIPGEIFQPNAIAILESPSYDFKNNPGVAFTLKYAYAKKSATHNDLFKVQASNDCGGNWTDIWSPSSSFLASGSGGITSEIYLSPIGDQWKLKDITADPHFYNFLNSDHVKFRYYFQEDIGGSGLGNRLYLDQVNFTTPVGVNEFSKELSLEVFPNPSHSEIHVSFILSDPSFVTAGIYDISGKELETINNNSTNVGKNELILNRSGSLEPGIYFLRIEINKLVLSRKILIE